jgi:hypothetical protein
MLSELKDAVKHKNGQAVTAGDHQRRDRGSAWELTSFLEEGTRSTEEKPVVSCQFSVLSLVLKWETVNSELTSLRRRRRTNKFHVNCYGHIVANRGGSSIYAEVFAVDRGRGRSSHVEVAFRVFDWRGGAIDVENNFFSHAVNG